MDGRGAHFVAFLALCLAATVLVLGAIMEARVRAVERATESHRRASEAWIETLRELNPTLVIPERGPFEEASK